VKSSHISRHQLTVLHLVHQLDVLLPQGAVLVSSLKNESQWLVGQATLERI